ncbi:MAG: peptide ABC transporter substrate-binding protein [Deltaproteobacteria bacterium]|nr:MAG: peptide ABC transporter substrate-binding protein [Deltaproteobacteria bacterium]
MSQKTSVNPDLNGISRRKFLAMGAALGASAALPGSFLTKSVFASTPMQGGTLKVGMAGGSTTESLDPATFDDVFVQMTSLGFLRNPLVEIDHKGNAVPELAQSWEATPNASRWIINLRKGVEFHNGKTMDADDVVYSINYHRDPARASQIKTLVDTIKSIKKDGPNQIIIELKGASADFPYILASQRMPIVPNGTANFQDGLGTGGYQLVEYEPGVRVLAKRFPNYWKENRAHFNEIDITFMSDVTARTTALMTGQVDVINKPDRKTAHLLKRNPKLKLVDVPGGLLYTFPMLCDTKPYTDNNLRMAVKYSVDRQQMLDTILQRYGTLGNDHPIAPIVKYTASDLPQRQYDPDKAKFYLKKAGMEGYEFKLHTSDAVFSGALDAAQLWQEDAKKAGLKMQVVKEPKDGYWDNVWNKKPFSAAYWFARATADWIFTQTYSGTTPSNDMHWQHERFNKLLVEARAELNQKKRGELYFEMQKIVRDEGGVVIPAIANMVDATTKKVMFENPSGNLELDGLRFCERWWFDS